MSRSDNYSAIAFLNSLADAIPEAGKVMDETCSNAHIPATRWRAAAKGALGLVVLI